MSSETIEGVYGECLLCKQVYIHGEALASCVWAVIVPNFSELRERLKQQGYPAGITEASSDAELCKSPAIVTIYRNELRVHFDR